MTWRPPEPNSALSRERRCSRRSRTSWPRPSPGSTAPRRSSNRTTARPAPARPRAEAGSRLRLFQAIADLIEAGAGAGFVQLGAGRAARPDGAHHLIADLDDHATAEEHHMRELRQ